MSVEKLYKAIQFANQVHIKQNRKDKETPYVVHVMSVSLILDIATDDQEIKIAGLLHDVIEDCKPYGSITQETIAEEFGERVARMVNDVTEQDKSGSWLERKMEALSHIKDMQHDSQLLKSADVLHNLLDTNADLEEIGKAVFERFNATQEEVVERYRLLINELDRVWPENPLLNSLKQQYSRMQKLIS